MNSIRLSKRATTLALASVFSVGVAVVPSDAASALPGTGSVTIACTKGSAPSITLGLGLNAAGSQRNMKIVGGGTDVLGYQLFQPPDTTPGTACPGTTVWDTSVGGTFTPTAPTTKASRTYNVC